MAKTKIQALLFDLDDTLLLNDMELFAPHYFRALVDKVGHVCPAAALLPALDEATRAMWHNDGRDGTNAEVFRRVFFSCVGREPQELMLLFDEFYAHDFESLRRYTAADPQARPLIELATVRGYQLAVATQPMFPLVAILARLRWAGVGAEEFHYDYVACYEQMSACKPHPHYFTTILAALGREPEECLMVGDSAESDLPARELGIKTFWVQRGSAAPIASVACDAQGSLGDLVRLIETGGLDAL